MIQEKYILVLQVVASVFMGLDYFLTEDQRGRLNGFLKRHLHQLQRSEQEFLTSTYLKARTNRSAIAKVFAIFSISLAIALYVIPVAETWLNVWVILLLVLISMLALFSSANVLFASICEDGVPFAFSLLKLSLARFLIRCPKGTGFGVGFLFLAISFICRGMNIDW
ncbi:hypothetical protein CXQ80_14205 [Pseudomonas sp. 02C 26]|uniref:hypothetical protein n=1 Tax=Pseudomonas sp. 02C 26 TaxID=2054914 RepID=UPI000C6EF2B3|nr:hypothetical protein [Pseudomonas sp. 02C 26]AUF96907.1 hypothetical protein CXQ80_14205 [Pseudomonas sp. 02C 26]